MGVQVLVSFSGSVGWVERKRGEEEQRVEEDPVQDHWSFLSIHSAVQSNSLWLWMQPDLA